MTTPRLPLGDAKPFAIALAASLVVIAAVAATFLALRRATEGAFLYVLDDPYIHLQLARTLALHGVYGLHADEVSAPSSSILWPLLLVPAARFAWFECVPFGLALASAAVLPVVVAFGIDAAARARQWTAARRLATTLALVVLTLAAGNPIGLPFTGMEQSLQVLLAAAAAVGLIRTVVHHQPPPWLSFVLVVAPLVRFESASITLAVCIVLLVQGHRRVALRVVVIAAAALGIFVVFLLAQGLDALPSSVIEKTFVETGWLAGRRLTHVEARWYLPMWLILALPIVGFVMWRRLAIEPLRDQRWLVAAAMLVVAAHVVAGRYHWGARYEVYVFAFALPLLGWCQAETMVRLDRHRLATALLVVMTMLLGDAYLRHGALSAPAQAAAIQAQPVQLARFVAEFWRAPVAVNDIGLVGLRGGVRVLDLVGLSARDIRRARSRGDAEAARVVEQAARRLGAEVAIFYPHWVGAYRPAAWVPVANLVTRTRASNLGGDEVAIYAMDPAGVAAVRAALTAFAVGLPSATTLQWRSPPRP